MKKNIVTSAMVAIMVSQCLAVSSCQKEEGVEAQTPVPMTVTEPSVSPKTGGLMNLAIRAAERIVSKLKKGSNAVPANGATGIIAADPGSLLPVCGLSIYSHEQGTCITDDGDYTNAPYDIIVEGELMATDHGIVYAIDSTLHSTEANWVFSSDTLTFSTAITISYSGTLGTLGVTDPITIAGRYPVYRDGQYLFIIIQ